MGKERNSTIHVQGTAIAILSRKDDDFISLTDMAKKFGGDDLIYSWMRNRNTLEFLGIWERIHNPSFKGVEFDTFKSQAGLNRFRLTPKKWIEATQAIGIQSRAGRYGGGTYAHKDLAFEFGSWLSPEFKLYLIKESAFVGVSVRQCGKGSTNERSEKLRKPPVLVGILQQQAYWANNRGETN